MDGRTTAPLSEATLSDAITVFEYFRHQHNRMMRDVGAGGFGLPTDPQARLRQRIERTLTAAGPDGLSRTELHRRLGNSAKADESEFVLDALHEDGTAAMTTIPTG